MRFVLLFFTHSLADINKCHSMCIIRREFPNLIAQVTLGQVQMVLKMIHAYLGVVSISALHSECDL